MRALVTGSNGFIARNLIIDLKSQPGVVVLTHDRTQSEKEFLRKLEISDIVFHLAGVNRSDFDIDFIRTNIEMTSKIIEHLEQIQSRSPIIFSSSSQAGNDTIYGKTKVEAENLLRLHQERTKSGIRIYRLFNVFGKYSRPDYNSVVATFCHRVANGLEISMPNPDAQLKLVAVDDVVRTFVNELRFDHSRDIFGTIEPVYETTVRELYEKVLFFGEMKGSQPIEAATGLDAHLKATFDYFCTLKMD